MTEIDVKINLLNEGIAELLSLQRACDHSKSSPPGTEGGGKTVNELEEIGKIYGIMFDHFSELISSTVTFLETAKTGFITSDCSIAKNLKK